MSAQKIADSKSIGGCGAPLPTIYGWWVRSSAQGHHSEFSSGGVFSFSWKFLETLDGGPDRCQHETPKDANPHKRVKGGSSYK